MISTPETSSAPAATQPQLRAPRRAARRPAPARRRSRPPRAPAARSGRDAAEEVARVEDDPQIEERVRRRRLAAEVDADRDQHRPERDQPWVGAPAGMRSPRATTTSAVTAKVTPIVASMPATLASGMRQRPGTARATARRRPRTAARACAPSARCADGLRARPSRRRARRQSARSLSGGVHSEGCIAVSHPGFRSCIPIRCSGRRRATFFRLLQRLIQT